MKAGLFSLCSYEKDRCYILMGLESEKQLFERSCEIKIIRFFDTRKPVLGICKQQRRIRADLPAPLVFTY